MEIIPSILTTSKEEFTRELEQVNSAPINSVHIDITDGEFVPNLTFADPKITTKVLRLEAILHLMVTEPLKILPLWAGVPNIKRVLFHYETNSDINSVVDAIHANGWKAGLVLNPHTPSEVVDTFVDKLDSVVFMGVVPGAQGNPLIPEVLEKVNTFKAKYPSMLVEWDGAVTAETISEIKNVGVDIVSPGHAIFGSGDPIKNIVKLQNLI